jgi:hypothetical protein
MRGSIKRDKESRINRYGVKESKTERETKLFGNIIECSCQ